MTQQTPSIFESHYKKLGLLPLSTDTLASANSDMYKPFIKVLYLPQGYQLKVDFQEYQTVEPSLFFVNSNQFLQIDQVGEQIGYMLYYNRDFYCIQIHDAEVACDGLLFNNLQNMPMVELPTSEQGWANQLWAQIEEELTMNESGQEEMLRVYLKQLIIRATRIWKKQELHQVQDGTNSDMEFYRDFSRLVEIHYKEKHSVADYADLLGFAPKTLTHKFKRLHLSQPNEVIKDRIILEAKRLLTYTQMSAKEIAYHLGYDDPAYFNRLFAQKVGDTTTNFRNKYLHGKKVQ
ncbi:helix-turn-helix domain-containing protein [Flectobacillus longus]|uniref:helix-turn-helix domain-containing protein n=1 Tax=Flectobacillus longus TaxID=2984207 RepID=UPI0024B761DA|nr:AraC family transcriptional regulator [Flectobacillus longus]MDI9879739.1 AraC family transcriptional regulator [Flectobacillus longus]